MDYGLQAWMLMSASLVLMMTTPALALFYGGMSRTKSVLNMLMMSFSALGLIGIVYAALAGLLIYRQFEWRRLYPMLVTTAALSSARTARSRACCGGSTRREAAAPGCAAKAAAENPRCLHF